MRTTLTPLQCAKQSSARRRSVTTDEELIFVLGDMLELGALSELAHREIGRFLATGRVRPDRLIVVGKWARLIGEEAERVGLSV
jgi:UDP-N-acetylmuramyl pentapeptide synthase